MADSKEITLTKENEKSPSGYYQDVRFYRPMVDIYEAENEFIMNLDMPGVKKENLVLKLEDDVHLLVEGHVDRNKRLEGQYLLNECYHTGYRRYFHLSEDIEREKIDAGYKDGVLTVHLPKKEKVKPREISIK